MDARLLADGAVGVASEPTEDGAYVVTVHFGGDRSRVLGKGEAHAYAQEIIRAAAQADYDAAMINQLRDLGFDTASAVEAYTTIAATRRPLNTEATAPLRLTPGVSATAGVGFMDVHFGQRFIGQWMPAEARSHATNVLDILAATELDEAYRRHLTDDVGISAARATEIVERLGADDGQPEEPTQ